MSNGISRRGSRGVTLIELMIVIVIISILAAVAIPGYRAYVIRVTRTDAKRELLSAASRLERCFTRTNDYRISGQAPPNDVCFTAGVNPQGTYRVTGNIQQLSFVLTAIPVGGQAADTKCDSFTLDQTGAQGVTGSGLTALQCWSGR